MGGRGGGGGNNGLFYGTKIPKISTVSKTYSKHTRVETAKQTKPRSVASAAVKGGD